MRDVYGVKLVDPVNAGVLDSSTARRGALVRDEDERIPRRADAILPTRFCRWF
jgi:hypothetical protein